MWAYVFIPWDWELSLSPGISLCLSLTSMHQASADATESYIVDIKASTQTFFVSAGRVPMLLGPKDASSFQRQKDFQEI